jgi:hypothetical protein
MTMHMMGMNSAVPPYLRERENPAVDLAGEGKLFLG